MQQKEIVGKIHTFENYNGLSVTKWTLHIHALLIFLVGHFSLLIADDPFYSSLRILFCWWHMINLQRSSWTLICTSQLGNCLAYFFPKFTDMKLMKLVETQLSLFTTFHVFFFQFLFCLSDMCACTILRENQKMQVAYMHKYSRRGSITVKLC